MINRNEELFHNYFQAVIERNKKKNIAEVLPGTLARLFTKDPACPSLDDDAFIQLKAELSKEGKALKADFLERFPGFPQIRADENNLLDIVNILQTRFLKATQGLQEYLDKWPELNNLPEKERNLCKRNILCSYIYKISMDFRDEFKNNEVKIDNLRSNSLSLINQLIISMNLETAEVPQKNKPLKDVRQFYSLSPTEICDATIKNMDKVYRDKELNEVLIALYSQRFLSQFIIAAEKEIPFIGERRKLLNQVKQIYHSNDDIKINELIATLRDEKNPIQQLLNLARQKKDKNLINICYDFVEENSPQIKTEIKSSAFFKPKDAVAKIEVTGTRSDLKNSR